MNKVLIFGGARTGTSTLSHCLRQVAYDISGDRSINLVIDEPLNHPIRDVYKTNVVVPNWRHNWQWNGYSIIKCFEEARLLHKFVINKDSHANLIVSKLTAGELYRVLDVLFDKYKCIKHVHDSLFHMNNKLLFDYAVDNNIKILFLNRKDLFSVCLSKCMSQQHGVWHTITPETRKAVDDAVYEAIPISQIQSLYEKFNRAGNVYTNYLASKDIDYYKVWYEEFLHPDNSMDQRIEKFKIILSYIDWPYVETDLILDALSPKTKQYTPEHYSKVPNIEEINKWRETL